MSRSNVAFCCVFDRDQVSETSVMQMVDTPDAIQKRAARSANAAKGGDGLRVREDMPRLIAQGHKSVTAAEKDLLKCVGVFFRKQTPGRFMMRVRMPNGFANSHQQRSVQSRDNSS